MLHSCWPLVCQFLIAEQKSSSQVLESSNNQDHADGNDECCGIGAPEKAIGVDGNVICLNATRTSHRVAQVAIHSQVASQGGGSCQCPLCDYGDVLIIYVWAEEGRC
jgi:hypothetical protein